MNNKGQVLILFVVLISFIFTLSIFLFDLFNYNYNKLKVDNFNKLIIREYYNKDLNNIEKLIEKNYDLISYNVFYKEDVLYISIKKRIKSIFLKEEINSYYKSYLNNNEIVVERVM